ncbi:hypothetical protein [Fodinicola feengrottensis]
MSRVAACAAIAVMAAGLAGMPAAADQKAAPALAGTVLLPTGDQINDISPSSGHRAGAVTPAASSGLGRMLVSLTLGGKSYEIPAAAMPYLGRGLDLSLFDVDALRAAESDQRVPVQVDYAGSQPAVPGITMTGAHTGYLTGSSGKTFGAALVKQFLADRAAGGHASGSGLFGGGAAISLAGAKTAPVVRPHFPMKTVTFTATDAVGKPDNLDPMVLVNLDDSIRIGADQDAISSFYNGSAKYSVPAGNYAAIAYFFDTDAAGNATAMRVVTRPQFSISDNTTVALAASEATSKVTMVTPRPADPQEGGFVFRRAPLTGSDLYLDVSVAPGGPIWVAPTKTPVSIGTLDTFPYRRLTSPKGSGVPYAYALQYPTSGVIPSQTYVASRANMATLDAYYYNDVDSVGVMQQTGMFPFEANDFVLRPDHQLSYPTHQTEYVSAGHGLGWFGGMAKYTHDEGGFQAWYGGQYDDFKVYSPGQSVRENWNAFPLHPAGPVRVSKTGGWDVQPPAERSGDTVAFNLLPFSDNEPGHTGMGIYGEPTDTVFGTYQIDQNGMKIAEGAAGDRPTVPSATLSPEPSTIRMVLDATREGPAYKLSTQSHTEWTWRSQHQTGPTLPAGYRCALGDQPPDNNCAVEPLMTVQTTIGGMSVHGTVAGGRQVVDVQLGHLPTAKPAAITGATVDFSTDDGKTWRPATVRSLGGGKFTACYTATTGFVTLRESGTDAAGGAISETVTRAYQLT